MSPGLQAFPERTKPNLQLVHNVGLLPSWHVKQFGAQGTHMSLTLNVFR